MSKTKERESEYMMIHNQNKGTRDVRRRRKLQGTQVKDGKTRKGNNKNKAKGTKNSTNVQLLFL